MDEKEAVAVADIQLIIKQELRGRNYHRLVTDIVDTYFSIRSRHNFDGVVAS